MADATTVTSIRKASNFGLEIDNESFGDGLNAKMDEFAAARLIAALDGFTEYAFARSQFAAELHQIVRSSRRVILPIQTEKTSWPFFPIKFRNPEELLSFQKELAPIAQTRRYYYPSMSEGYTGNADVLCVSSLKISIDLAGTSLCLPVIPSLEKNEREILQ